MSISVVAKKTIKIGGDEFVDGSAPEGPCATVFEDDGNTGYFYALDRSQPRQQIQNALHIYNVADVTDRHKDSEVKVGWSLDNMKAVLLINDYPHAVFDFAAKRGYCRTGFPKPSRDSGWSGHDWDESAIQLFAE